MVTMSQGERGILEFKYKFPGQYMFHAHKTEFAEKGWMGLFFVKDSKALQSSSDDVNDNNTTTSIVYSQNRSKFNLEEVSN